MSALTLERLLVDPADLAGSPQIVSYTVSGDDGTAIGHVSDALKVSVAGTVTTTANFSYAEDSAVVSGDFVAGAGVQRHDANTSTVSADGDYSLMHVNALGGLKTSLMSVAGNDLVINADGSINVVADISVVTGSDKAEDAASASGDIGTFVLAVTQATLAASVSADGDYAAFKLDSIGALWTHPTSQVADDDAFSEKPLAIAGKAFGAASALAALSASGDKSNLLMDLYRRVYINDAPNIGAVSTAAAVTNSSASLVTAMAGRTRILVQNQSASKSIFLGASGVTTSTGIEVTKGGTLALELGQGVALFAIAATAGPHDVRVLELG